MYVPDRFSTALPGFVIEYALDASPSVMPSDSGLVSGVVASAAHPATVSEAPKRLEAPRNIAPTLRTLTFIMTRTALSLVTHH